MELVVVATDGETEPKPASASEPWKTFAVLGLLAVMGVCATLPPELR